jgi:hypothetical protein
MANAYRTRDASLIAGLQGFRLRQAANGHLRRPVLVREIPGRDLAVAAAYS